MTYTFIEVIGDCRLHQEGFMWVIENDTCTSWGKSREEAIANMADFLEKDKRFMLQPSE